MSIKVAVVNESCGLEFKCGQDVADYYSFRKIDRYLFDEIDYHKSIYSNNTEVISALNYVTELASRTINSFNK